MAKSSSDLGFQKKKRKKVTTQTTTKKTITFPSNRDQFSSRKEENRTPAIVEIDPSCIRNSMSVCELKQEKRERVHVGDGGG